MTRNKTENSQDIRTPNFKWLKLWMRIVGAFYLFLFVAAAILKLPIQTLAPEGTLEKADAGDAVARFLVDTWVILGLAIGALGVALLLASRVSSRAKVLVWTVIGFELIWGLCSDMYQLMRGHSIEVIGIWIVIHIAFITTGMWALQGTRITED